jgi:hypothetical protein
LVRSTSLAADVLKHEERAAEHPTPIMSVEPQRNAERGESEAPRCAPKSEQSSLPVLDVVIGRHLP